MRRVAPGGRKRRGEGRGNVLQEDDEWRDWKCPRDAGESRGMSSLDPRMACAVSSSSGERLGIDRRFEGQVDGSVGKGRFRREPYVVCCRVGGPRLIREVSRTLQEIIADWFDLTLVDLQLQAVREAI